MVRALITSLVVLWSMAMSSQANAAIIVGHRGASEDAPENTVAAYKLAFQQQADAIECDVYGTKDGKLILIHDATTDRTTGHKGKVAEMTFDQLRALDAGSWKDPKYKGEKLPTFREYLACVQPGKKAVIEIKAGPEIVPAVLKEIDESGLKPEQIILISFKEDVIAAAKQAKPNLHAAWLYAFKKKEGKWTATDDEVISRLKASKADDLSIGFTKESAEIINEKFVAKVKAAGCGLQVWTIDDADLAKRAIDLGALAVTTNRPGKLRAELGK